MAETDSKAGGDKPEEAPREAEPAAEDVRSSEQTQATFDVISDYLRPGRENVMLIYILYVGGMIPAFGVVPIIAGFVIAVLNRGNGTEVWNSHYDYMVRQAVIGLVAMAISFVLVFILIGVIGLILTAIWWLIRSIKGLIAASRYEAIPDPTTYSW